MSPATLPQDHLRTWHIHNHHRYSCYTQQTGKPLQLPVLVLFMLAYPIIDLPSSLAPSVSAPCRCSTPSRRHCCYPVNNTKLATHYPYVPSEAYRMQLAFMCDSRKPMARPACHDRTAMDPATRPPAAQLSLEVHHLRDVTHALCPPLICTTPLLCPQALQAPASQDHGPTNSVELILHPMPILCAQALWQVDNLPMTSKGLVTGSCILLPPSPAAIPPSDRPTVPPSLLP